MDYSHVANAYGKQDLGGGEYVGITLELRDGWRLAFEARLGPDTELMTVSGGNLVGLDENGDIQNPIYPTAYTQVVIAQSTSPSIKEPESDTNLLYMVEYLTGSHKSIGSVYYWDPLNGDDANDGTTPSNAVETFAQAHTLCTDGAHDIIFALSTNDAGPTTTTETITISKDAVKLRGPGFPFQLAPGSSGSDTITISGNNVEVSGFYISTNSGGTDNAIAVTGDNALVKDLWIKDATGNGINITSAERTQVSTIAIEDVGGIGISLGDSTTRSLITNTIISGSTGDAVNLEGTGVADNIFENNIIYNNGGWGIDIVDSSILRTGIRLHHTISDNSSGSINDQGTDTFQDTSGAITSGDIDAIVDGVWDEVIGGHLTAGTTGRTLRDAKTKATLASLK
jgi:hypothetical protein